MAKDLHGSMMKSRITGPVYLQKASRMSSSMGAGPGAVIRGITWESGEQLEFDPVSL